MAPVTPDSWTPQGVRDLESSAWEALRECDHNVCLTAGAGAGKTEFLAQKAAYLLQTGLCPEPRRIVAISFKRDAARNLAARVEKRCSPTQSRRFHSFTFDGFTKGLLDRFRAGLPAPYSPPPSYRIDFPNRLQMDNFLMVHGLQSVSTQQLERGIALTKLPLDNGTEAAVQAYWRAQYNDYDQVLLTFPMINRLVEWLLRINPQIQKALQQTYPFVFLDEFQDTTLAQYELLRTAFDGSGAVFTAVGDAKQRIMGWAGALPDAVSRFTDDYGARNLALISNWRSHEDLVVIQHIIAQHIEPLSEQPEARGPKDVDGEVTAIWHFRTDEDEAAGLAAWISREVKNGIEPHSIAILVRQKPNDLEAKLAEPMSRVGVKIRNLARNVGDISIQDLLSEDLTQILLPLLRLGATEQHPEAWNKAVADLCFLEGVYEDDESGQEILNSRLQDFVRDLRSQMTSVPPCVQSVRDVAQRSFDFIGAVALQRAFSAYQRHEDLSRAWVGFVELLVENARGPGSWIENLDRFEGIGQVALMTIHKSKGLEFHTMIFCGLENKSWWSLTPGKKEELSSFFVAFTRAKQRAFFTLSAQRGEPLSWLEQIVAPAGLRRVAGPS